MDEIQNSLVTSANFESPSSLTTDEKSALIRRPPFFSPPTPLGPNGGMAFFVNTVRRWWKWALPIGLILGGAGAGLVYWLFTPYYEAVSWLRIDSHQQFIAFETRSEDRDTNKVYVQTQIESLRSPMVLGPVLADPQIARMPEIIAQTNPLQWLAKQITVKQVGESEYYHVLYSAPSPNAAAKVVNAIVDKYFWLHQKEDAGQNEEVIKILNQERNERGQELRILRKDVRDLARQATGKDPFAGNPEPVAIMNHPLADIQNHLITAEVDEEVLKARIKAYQEANSRPIELSDASVESKLESHPSVMRLKQELLTMQSQLRGLDSYAVRKDKSPSRQQLVQEIGDSEKALEQLRKGLRQSIRQDMQATIVGKRNDTIADLQTELDSRRITAEMLREKYENELKDVKQTSGDTLQLRLKQAELERAEKIDDLIAERIVKLRTERSAPPRVVLAKEAITPVAPVETFPFRNVFLAALAGLGFPFAVVLGWEKIFHRVGDAANLENEARHRVLAEIARLPSRPVKLRNRHPSSLGFDLRMFEESVDSLRTTLMLTDELHHVRILAVTSAVNHEGKTSVAAQLAMSLERATDSPILLIDGDMRDPDLHTLFDTPLEPGLTWVLEGKCSIEEAIIPIKKSNLSLLPGGKLKSNPHQLLGNGSKDALRRAIPERFRYVIIDTPPILAASEALMLASLADASVVCRRRDISRVDQVKRAYERLQTTGGNPVGFVLNGVPPRTYAFRYGSYSY